MTEIAPAWIAPTLCRLYERHGADLDQVVSGRFTAQIVKFTAFRTEENPHAPVEAVLAEAAHRVHCVFDVRATDSFERSVAGEPEERLTSNLYAFIRIGEFRIRLRQRTEDRGVPQVVLELLQWDILSTGRRVPPSHRVARDVGADARVGNILKAWWTGLSLSSSVPQSSLARSNATTQQLASSAQASERLFSADPVPPPIMSAEEQKPEPAEASKPRDDVMTRWPQMYKRLYSKGSRGLPGWLFDEPSAEQQAQLDAITVFGLDLARAPSQAKGSQASASGSGSQPQSLTPPLDEGAGPLDPIEVAIPPVPSHPPPTPPMSSSPAPAPAPSPAVPAPPVPVARHRTPLHPPDSDDEAPRIRPLRRRERAPSDTPASRAGETSDSELSEYERRRRRIAKGKMRAYDPEPSGGEDERVGEGEEQEGEEEEEMEEAQRPPRRAAPDSQSLSQSQDSRDFALARFAAHSLPDVTPPREGARAGGAHSMPPLARSSPPAEGLGRKRPRYSDDRDESAPEMGPPPAQRLRTEPVSSAREWGDAGPPSGQRCTPVKAEAATPRTPRLSVRPERASPAVKVEAQPEVETDSFPKTESAPPSSAERPERPPSHLFASGKLGGWRPDLAVRGLTAEYVARVTRAARDLRDRRRVKREPAGR